MLRIGVIGLGNIGRVHVKNLQDGLVKDAELVAVAEQASGALDEFKELGVSCFTDASELIRSGEVDAVVVALPTQLHAPVGIEVLESGLHLMMEKPLGRHKAEAERILAARERDDQVIALMMNQRTNPCFVKMKQWMDEGAVGTLQRVAWFTTNWFRPEIYFQSSAWRATWRGEGGGALMNQCPHNLDVMQWLVGMPVRIRANCFFGKYHDLEVEDEVTAYLEYGNGATGLFVTSTGEWPGVNRLEIIGDLGTMTTDGNTASLMRNSESAAAFSKSTKEMFGTPETETEQFEPGDAVNQHAAILDNFARAISEGETLIAPAEEGLNSVELAGAMIYSTWTDGTVELPLDSAAYEARLEEAIAQSKPRQIVQADTKVDMSKSFR